MSHKVYEDDRTLVFLDIHPIRIGHALVIPKTHESDVHHLSEGDYMAVMLSAKEIAVRLEKEMHPKRIGMLIAGWDVPHVHVHVVPMENYHDLTSQVILDGTRGNPSQEELRAVAEKIRVSS